MFVKTVEVKPISFVGIKLHLFQTRIGLSTFERTMPLHRCKIRQRHRVFLSFREHVNLQMSKLKRLGNSLSLQAPLSPSYLSFRLPFEKVCQQSKIRVVCEMMQPIAILKMVLTRWLGGKLAQSTNSNFPAHFRHSLAALLWYVHSFHCIFCTTLPIITYFPAQFSQ